MKTMVITGGNGFIASLVKEAMQSSMEIIPLTRKELDLGAVSYTHLVYFSSSSGRFLSLEK